MMRRDARRWSHSIVDALGEIDGMAVVVNRVQVLDFFTAPNVSCDDVGRMNGIDLPRDGPWVIRRVAAIPDGVSQSMRMQNALYRGDTG
jgi:hypothetical protein